MGDFGRSAGRSLCRWGGCLRYTAAIGALGLTVYVIARELECRHRTLQARVGAISLIALRVTLGALPFVLGLMAYHQRCFGGPLESGYRHLADAGTAVAPGRLSGDPHSGATGVLAIVLSPLRGLFALSPFLLLGFWGLGRLKMELRDRPLFLFVATISVAYAYFTSSFSYESWGWTPGPGISRRGFPS